jgi:acyl carrier protein
MSASIDGDAFVARLVDWINRTLVPAGVTIGADTPLFESGLIDSLKILRLIAWTEHATGRRIPDTSIRMDNFRTARRIADVFCAPRAESGGSNVAA